MLSDAKKLPPTLTANRLRELLNYYAQTGVFTWRIARKKCSVGAVAGSKNNGYIAMLVEGRYYRAHRLAWLYVYGRWPSSEIDHVNQVRDDNRIDNLREVSSSQNKQNTPKQKNNTSGFRGVSWYKRDGRWQAKIALHGKCRFLGLFDSPEEASAAYETAASVLHTHRPVLEDDQAARLKEIAP